MTGKASESDLLAAVQGEVRRARERAWELGRQLETLGEWTSLAVEDNQPADDARRLGALVLSGVVALNELANIVGKLTALGAVVRDL